MISGLDPAKTVPISCSRARVKRIHAVGLAKTPFVSRYLDAPVLISTMYSSLKRNDIEFYFDFVFDLNRAARDAYGTYAEVALLERCRTAIVSPI